MNLRSLVVGCVLGLSLALVPSCGPGGGGGTGGGAGTTGGSGGTTGGSGGTTGGGAGNGCIATAANTCTNTADSCFPISQNSDTGKCVAGACHIAPSDCANAAHNCLFTAGSSSPLTTVCYPAGDAGVGEACTSPTQCQRGSGCLGMQGGGAQKCTKWCYDDVDCGGTGICNIFVSFGLADGGTAGHGAFACSFPTACEPLTPTACAGGEGCYIVNAFADGGLQFGCATAGTTADGQPCSGSTDCVAGSTCVPTNPQQTAFACRKMCNTDAGTPSCTSGTCTAAMGDLGLCL